MGQVETMDRDSPSWHTSIKSVWNQVFSGDQYAIGGVDLSTGEETGNGNTTITAAFSVYPDYGACIRQRGWMLSREPYASKVSAYRNKTIKIFKEDARGFMNGIRAAGWATDSSYVENVCSTWTIITSTGSIT